MITRIEIAARIGDAQYRLAAGEVCMDVGQDLLRLRDEIMAEEAAAQTIEGYRRDAVEQIARLIELLAGIDLGSAPDMELFHITVCAELARQKMAHYFDLRNRAAEGRIKIEVGQ